MTASSDRLPIFESIEDGVLHPIRTVESWFERAPAQAPATQPATMAAAAAPAKENTVSLTEELGKLLAPVEAEVAKVRQNLPAVVAEAEALASSPLGQIAVQVGEHVAAEVLPASAVSYLAANWQHDLDQLVSLWNPKGLPAAAPAEAADPQQPADTGQPIQ